MEKVSKKEKFFPLQKNQNDSEIIQHLKPFIEVLISMDIERNQA